MVRFLLCDVADQVLQMALADPAAPPDLSTLPPVTEVELAASRDSADAIISECVGPRERY